MKAWSRLNLFKRDKRTPSNFSHWHSCYNLLRAKSTQGDKLRTLTVPRHKVVQSNSKRAGRLCTGSESGTHFSASVSFFFLFIAAAHTTRDAEALPTTSVNKTSLPVSGGGGRGAARSCCRDPGCGAAPGAVRPAATGGHDSPPLPAPTSSGGHRSQVSRSPLE